MEKLVFPNKTHKKMWEKLIKERKEWLKMPSAFFQYKSFEEFLKWVNDDLVWVKWKVPGHLFFMIDSEKTDEIIWVVQIRHSINHPNLIEDWGHIWYWINPKFRKKWYGTKLLSLTLKKIKELDLKINKLLITCRIENIWSAKVIENNSWVFERLTKDWKKKRYFIGL